MIRVLIADDQKLIRDSMSLLLSMREGIEVVGTAEDGFKAVEMVETLKPDIALMDARMPGMDGLEASSAIRKSGVDCKIIILTTFNDDEYISKAVKNGVDGYILKGVGIEQIEQAIKTAVMGGTTISPQVASRMIQLFQHDDGKNDSAEIDESMRAAIGELNSTERKVMYYVGKGMSNKEISAQMYLSSGTVRNAVSSILDKLNVENRTQLAIIAVKYQGEAEETDE